MIILYFYIPCGVLLNCTFKPSTPNLLPSTSNLHVVRSSLPLPVTFWKGFVRTLLRPQKTFMATVVWCT